MVFSFVFSSVSGEKAEWSEFQPCVRLWLGKMREVCSGVHVIIDFSLNQSGSLEDLFGLPGITTERRDGSYN